MLNGGQTMLNGGQTMLNGFIKDKKQELLKIAVREILTFARDAEPRVITAIHDFLKAQDLPIPDTLEQPLDALLEASARETYSEALAMIACCVEPPAGPPAP